MVRRRGTTLRTAFRIIGDCPVARWRGGGRHLPVLVTLHYRRFQFVRPRPQPQWPQWKCAILTSKWTRRDSIQGPGRTRARQPGGLFIREGQPDHFAGWTAALSHRTAEQSSTAMGTATA